VAFYDNRLHVAPVKASAPPEARAFADRAETMMPHVRIIHQQSVPGARWSSSLLHRPKLG
jgi:hypothetical protein